MNPVTYTLNLQRICIAFASSGFCVICFILATVNPYNSTVPDFFIWLFLTLLILVLSSTFTLLVSWWVFSIQKQVLDIPEVNQIVYQSIVTSGMLVLVLVMFQTNQLSIWSTAFVTITYILYEVWINSN